MSSIQPVSTFLENTCNQFDLCCRNCSVVFKCTKWNGMECMRPAIRLRDVNAHSIRSYPELLQYISVNIVDSYWKALHWKASSACGGIPGGVIVIVAIVAIRFYWRNFYDCSSGILFLLIFGSFDTLSDSRSAHFLTRYLFLSFSRSASIDSSKNVEFIFHLPLQCTKRSWNNHLALLFR